MQELASALFHGKIILCLARAVPDFPSGKWLESRVVKGFLVSRSRLGAVII
jgi:hypothetical protein